jgi:hypothetical protein
MAWDVPSRAYHGVTLEWFIDLVLQPFLMRNPDTASFTGYSPEISLCLITLLTGTSATDSDIQALQQQYQALKNRAGALP